MADNCSPSCCTDLDPSSLVTVASFLQNIRDIANFQRTCSLFVEPACSNSVWSPLLLRDYDVSFKSTKISARALYVRLRTEPHKHPIRFRAAYTTGGMDANERIYWADNIFHPSHWNYHCSDVAKNISCVGVLEDEHEADDKDLMEHREFLIKRCRWPVAQAPDLEAPGDALHSVQAKLEALNTTRLEEIFIRLLDSFFMDLEVGKMLLYEVRHANRQHASNPSALAAAFQAEMMQLRAKGISIRRQELLQRPQLEMGRGMETWDQRFLPFFLDPTPTRLVGIINSVTISRQGNFTCPIRCGAVLTAYAPPAPRALSSEPSLAINQLRSLVATRYCAALDNVTSMEQVLQASDAGHLPPVLRTGSFDGGQWAEFDRPLPAQEAEPAATSLEDAGAGKDGAATQLVPLLWFRFYTKQELVASGVLGPGDLNLAWGPFGFVPGGLVHVGGDGDAEEDDILEDDDTDLEDDHSFDADADVEDAYDEWEEVGSDEVWPEEAEALLGREEEEAAEGAAGGSGGWREGGSAEEGAAGSGEQRGAPGTVQEGGAGEAQVPLPSPADALPPPPAAAAAAAPSAPRGMLNRIWNAFPGRSYAQASTSAAAGAADNGGVGTSAAVSADAAGSSSSGAGTSAAASAAAAGPSSSSAGTSAPASDAEVERATQSRLRTARLLAERQGAVAAAASAAAAAPERAAEPQSAAAAPAAAAATGADCAAEARDAAAADASGSAAAAGRVARGLRRRTAAHRAEDVEACCGVDVVPRPSGTPVGTLRPAHAGAGQLNVLHAALTQARACNVAVVKMISPEDRMREMSDMHDKPNIDVEFVALQGTVLRVPAALGFQQARAAGAVC